MAKRKKNNPKKSKQKAATYTIDSVAAAKFLEATKNIPVQKVETPAEIKEFFED